MEVWRIEAAKENTLERAARADKIGSILNFSVRRQIIIN